MSFTAILTVSRLFALYHTVFLFELCHRLGGQKNSWMMGLVGLWFVLRAAWRLMAWSVWDLSHWTGDPGGDGEHPLWGRPGGDRPEGWGQEEPHGTQKTSPTLWEGRVPCRTPGSGGSKGCQCPRPHDQGTTSRSMEEISSLNTH